MSWSQVSDRRWERPIDGIEGYFVLTGAVGSCMRGSSALYPLRQGVGRAERPPVELALKQAWTQLRYEQPQIASTTALQAWLDATFAVSSTEDTEALWDTATPITQTTLYYLPRSSEITLRAHHYIVDGVGLLMLLYQYLNALAQPAVEPITFGDEGTRLAPPLAEVLGVPDEPTAGQTESKAPGIGPVSKVNREPAGRCRNSRLIFPPQTTEAIIQVCKEKGMTVTSAVHAAYILSLSKEADPSTPSSHYVSSASFDLRRYLPALFDSARYAASVWYTIAIPHRPTDLVLGCGTGIESVYCTSFRDNHGARLAAPHFNRFMETVAGSAEYQTAPIPQDALPSSLGIIGKYVQRTYGDTITVRDLMVGVDVVLGMSMFFISTFRDKMQIIYSLNDGYEGPGDIDRCLEGIRNFLIEELLA
ncbi:hypothetical protein BDV11DRAFT_215777 [Aspergillus similis]